MKTTTSSSGLFARQRLSSVGKTAFWTLLVSTILSLGGVIALTLLAGTPSSDILISFISALIALLCVISGVRWLQLLGTLASAYHCYQFFTVPYVIASLNDPKSTQIAGGFGKFEFIVIAITLSLIAFIACVALSVQNYRGTERQTPRWFSWAVSCAIGIMLGALLLGAVLQPSASASTTFTNGVPTVHMNADSFTQSSITISKGSKLLLVDDTSVMHVLGNGSWQNGTARPVQEVGAPVVNNLQVQGKSVEIGPFLTTGTYHIYCLVHVGMELTVIVQ
jgi:plastocyanin